MGRVRIGTASWTDRSLIESGRYYPAGCTSAEARLRFYSAEFPLVEVDSTYYGMPSERNSLLWAERTPSSFTFNVKAFRLFTTHQTPPRALPVDVRRALPATLADKRNLYYGDLDPAARDKLWEMFRSALRPLEESGKLGVIVLQFPPWFAPRRDRFRHMEECREHLSGLDVAVEFRNRLWLEGESLEETFSFLRRNGLSYVAVDEPQGFRSSVPPEVDVTGSYGMVRFHGRNRDTWEARGLKAASDRFDYYYSRQELEEWVPRIRILAENASQVHLLMNTNNSDQGIANARLLGELLGEGF